MLFSRNDLGVYTPQDILAGAATGVAAPCLARGALRWADAGPRRDLLVLAAGLTPRAAVIAYAALKPYPKDYVNGVLLVDPVKMQPDAFSVAGAVAGLLLGWVWERRVRFETAGSVVAKLIRFASGVFC